jgi:hypothetical protein
MNRLHQLLLIGTFLPLCWFGMMAVHELGHVLGALVTGGRIEKVVLHPLTISRTDVSPNPAPLLVVWAGPTVGVLLPLALLGIARAGKCGWGYLAQFFAGFCLIANGGYVGGGSFGGRGNASDPGVMLTHGSPTWSLGLFAAAAFPLGLWLWNGLGPHFGLGAANGKVDRHLAYASCVLLLLVVFLEAALSPR